MTSILYYIVAILLMFIAAEDLRYRKIRILWFVIIIPLLITVSVIELTPAVWLQTAGINLLAAALTVMVGLTLVVLSRRPRLSKTSKLAGGGDLLMILLLCIALSLPLYMMVLMASLLLSLAYCAGCRLAGKPWKKAPLAGITAAVLSVVIILNRFTHYFPLGDNEWFMNKMPGL